MKEKLGELIQLCWDGNLDAYYVKGHVDKGLAVTVVEHYHGALSMGKSPVVEHVWAKWCKATEDDGVPEGCEFTFRVRQSESRGWFKVTEVKPTEVVEKGVVGMMDNEICICAAIMDERGYVWRGHRHGDCIALMIGEGHSYPESKQGFVTSRNRFVTREEGMELQLAAGIPSKGGGYRGKRLFSEDLY